MARQQEFLRGLVRTFRLRYYPLDTNDHGLLFDMPTEHGVEKKVELDNLSLSDVSSKIAQLLSLS